MILFINLNNLSFGQSFLQNGRVGYDSTIYHPNTLGIGFEPAKSVIAPSAIIDTE